VGETGGWPSSVVRFRNHANSDPVWFAAMYSASVVDFATTVWRLLLQLTRLFPMKTVYPLVERAPSAPAQSESV
jgi:hypothetical protein